VGVVHKMKNKHKCKELSRLLREMESGPFTIKRCKSGKIKVYSRVNKDKMYSVHEGKKAIGPLKQFYTKNKDG
jgi:hypothetical protein